MRGPRIEPAALAWCLAAAALASCAAPAAAADAPAWLRQAAAATLTPAQAASPAVVLLDQMESTVASDGTVTTQRLYAARLHTREGRDAGTVSEVYLTDSGRVRRMRAWIIRPGGGVQELGESHVVDAALAPNDVYNEARLRMLSAGDVEPGTVFGAEVVAEDRAIFGQVEWPLQASTWPVKSVRRSLTVPAGWTVQATVFNRAPLEPAVSGTTHTWALADLPKVADETASPPAASVLPRLAVTYTPDGAARSGIATFQTWPAVSAWLATLNDPQAAADAALTAKAKSLTAGAATPIERVRAIAEWLRQVQYISVQIGLGRGGGYRPRRAADVFARNHGDCKDKATLMRSMLAAVGVTAYPAAVYLGDRTFVREAWPSPQQFNHVIVAIAVDSVAPYPGAAVAHPTVGPLLFFDPTDPYTRPGVLPADEEGSFALVVVPKGGELLRLPASGAAGQASTRVLDGALQPDGTFAGTVTRRATGRFAALERAFAAELDPREYVNGMSRRVAAAMPGARVQDATTKDREADVETSARVSVQGFAQPLPNDLVMVTPPFRALERAPLLTAAARTLPAVLEGETVVETLRLTLPPGYVVDELPEAAAVDAPYGRYRLTARTEGAIVVVDRQLVLERVVVAPGDVPALRRFLEAARAADTSPVILKRAPVR